MGDSVTSLLWFKIDFGYQPLDFSRSDLLGTTPCLLFVIPSQKEYCQGFPHSSVSKESDCNVGDPGSVPGLGRSPPRRRCQLTPVSLPRESRGQRIPAGYSPCGHNRRTQFSDQTTTVCTTLNKMKSPLYSIPKACWILDNPQCCYRKVTTVLHSFITKIVIQWESIPVFVFNKH